MSRRLLAASLALLLAACSKTPPVPLPDAGSPQTHPDAGAPDAGSNVPAFRCDLDLTPFTRDDGQGAFARHITDASDLLTGDGAQGKVGDYLLGNDQVRVVIQGPDRHLGPGPFGGTILDAALTGATMHDEFGEVSLLYNFGRTVDAQDFEVLSDGSQGGSAIIAASGRDALNDWLGIKNQLRNKLGKVPAVDPDQALPLRITNYFVLNPGEKRVRYLTALCNEGSAPVTLAVGDLTDPGGSVEFFNPDACVHGFGYTFGATCFGLDPLSWYGYQGVGVAYGYAPYRVGAPQTPEESSSVLTVAGVTGSIISAPGLQGLLDWFDDTLAHHGGQLDIPAGGQGVLSRDFVIGRDLGEVASVIETGRSARNNRPIVPITGHIYVAGEPLAGARVALERSLGVETVFTTDGDGAYSGQVYAGNYQLSAWAPGHAISTKVSLTLSAGAPVEQDLTLGPTRTLTVRVHDERGSPLPAKVTLVCVGACPAPESKLDLYTDITRDPVPEDVQFQDFVPPSGTATFQVPPGHYQALVSRGPSYSIWPASWPSSGYDLDLSAADKSLDATVVKVIDSTGWLGSDFHVHSVNSPDSYVANSDRVLSFLGEGMEVLVATDHDYVTDLAPYNQALGGQSLMATVVGEEASPMDFGHYILFPYFRDGSDLNGGALDWAGGSGPTLTLGQLFSAGHAKGATTIQFNHPRGYLGGLSYLQVDTDTLASHAPAASFRMAPSASSASDTGLMSGDFNTLELLNPGLDLFDANSNAAHAIFNDWFTMLSTGMVVTGTGVSDTHQRFATAAGYWRTYVHTGTTASDLTAPVLSEAVNNLKATVSNGPFVKFTAHRLDAQGNPVGTDVEPGGTVPVGTGDLELTLDIQVPEYMDLTHVELYTHLPADDDRCPVDTSGPNASTNRVACDGQPNVHWPTGSIFESRDIVLSPTELETVTTAGGVTYRRYHHIETFIEPAPSTDTWFIPFVYGSTDLFPLVYAGTDTTNNRKPAKPFALANPIFVDADGGGYDHPPFHPARPPAPHVPPRPPAPAPPARVEAAKLLEVLEAFQKH